MSQHFFDRDGLQIDAWSSLVHGAGSTPNEIWVLFPQKTSTMESNIAKHQKETCRLADVTLSNLQYSLNTGSEPLHAASLR